MSGISELLFIFLVLPGIICIVIGIILQKYKPQSKRNIVGFSLSEGLWLTINGIIFIASGIVLMALAQ